jgi:hypothetical protein
MATVHSLSNSSAAGGPPGSGPTYLVSTRELSEDFSRVGPEESSRELGAIDKARFLHLLERLVAIDTLKLVDGDPQVFATVKSGRFLIQPQGGKLLVRPVNALDLIFFKLSPAEVPAFLDGVPIASPAPSGSTLIGAATARVEAAAATTAPGASSGSSAPATPRKARGFAGIGAVAAGVLIAGGLAWFLFLRKPAGPPPPPVVTRSTELDPITSPTQLDAVKQRLVGSYATGGDVAERLLELRADGTFRYQEFGAGATAAKSESGAYTILLHRGTETPAIRAAALGVIELRDENSLVVRQVVFTRFYVPE